MIYGVGTDILSLERLSRILEHDRGFEKGVYTPRELELIRSRPEQLCCYATRFAGKEAVFKALRLDGNTRWTEIEILSEPDGAPRVQLHGAAAQYAAEQGVTAVRLSLSSEDRYACAFAVALAEEAGYQTNV